MTPAPKKRKGRKPTIYTIAVQIAKDAASVMEDPELRFAAYDKVLDDLLAHPRRLWAVLREGRR